MYTSSIKSCKTRWGGDMTPGDYIGLAMVGFALVVFINILIAIYKIHYGKRDDE